MVFGLLLLGIYINKGLQKIKTASQEQISIAGSDYNQRFNFYPLNNRYLRERKRAMGNDMEAELRPELSVFGIFACPDRQTPNANQY